MSPRLRPAVGVRDESQGVTTMSNEATPEEWGVQRSARKAVSAFCGPLSRTAVRRWISFTFAALIFGAAEHTASAQISVLTNHNDKSRSGANLNETQLSPA